MKIRIVAAIAIQLLLTLTGIGQSGKIGSPVKWERYGVPRTDVSVLLPKLPIRIDSYNPCNQLAYSEYWAYADNAAYGIRIFAKYKTDRSYCKTTEDFGKRSFDARISKWSSEKDTVASETEVLGSTRKARVFSSKVCRVVIVDDLSTNRWIEVEIVRAWPRRFVSTTLSVPVGATVAEALAALPILFGGLRATSASIRPVTSIAAKSSMPTVSEGRRTPVRCAKR